MAQLARARCGIESVVHYCCRDRNLLGMQMDLLGAHALGLHNILAVTGDPPKMGTYPNATAVVDIDVKGLCLPRELGDVPLFRDVATVQ